jgi:flagellin
MRIANNVPAIFTQLHMRRNDRGLQASMNRLATGLRINSAREDAAGMAVANKLSFQITGLERSGENASHGISIVQTAEGALEEVHAMLQRIRELAVQAANDTLVHEDRARIQMEVDELTDEVNAISTRTEFNTIKLLNGEAARMTTVWMLDTVNPPALTRNVVTPLLISEGFPAGNLQFELSVNPTGGYLIDPESLVLFDPRDLDRSGVKGATPPHPFPPIFDNRPTTPPTPPELTVSNDGDRFTITTPDGETKEMNIFVPLGSGFPTTMNMEMRIEDFGGLRVQIGPNYNMAMFIQIPRVNAETLGLVHHQVNNMVRLLDLETREGADTAIGQMDDAMRRLSEIRSRLGSQQNRLEHTIRSLDSTTVNTENARMRIQDTDMAKEATNMTKRNVLLQAGMSILGQANQRPQMILQLLN